MVWALGLRMGMAFGFAGSMEVSEPIGFIGCVGFVGYLKAHRVLMVYRDALSVLGFGAGLWAFVGFWYG